MEVFRIYHEKYSNRLTSSGSANRWNLQGQLVIYTGSSRSLSTLELVVHRNMIVPTFQYKVMVISVADEENLIKHVRLADLPADWRSLNAYSKLQRLGSEWYQRQETLILKVPSAIISQEYNYVINTEHPAFSSKVQLVRTEDYFWDNRLL